MSIFINMYCRSKNYFFSEIAYGLTCHDFIYANIVLFSSTAIIEIHYVCTCGNPVVSCKTIVNLSRKVY